MLITIPEKAARYHQPIGQSASAPIRRNTDQSLRKTRVIRLQRPLSNSYGFHLRGGQEHGTGFFISHVDVGSEAYTKGLRTGDQVVKVNNYSISKALHKEVASIVQSSREVLLEVRSTGIIPVKNNARDPLCWVPVDNDQKGFRSYTDTQPYSLKSNGSSQSSNSSLPPTPFLIVMSGAGKSTIGCSICKGPAEKPGIFVQRIIEKGVADEAGLRPGDQILSCNGHSFINIEFQQAVQQMKCSPCLRLEILRGAGMDLISGESSGYNSSVSSEEENYPSSENDSYKHIYADTCPKESSSLFLDARRDWKEIEAEWADAEVSEKRCKLQQSTLPHRQINPSKSLLNLSMQDNTCEHGVFSLQKKLHHTDVQLGRQPMSKLSTARSMSDIRANKSNDNFKISLQTTSEAHVSKIVIPSVPKNEKNALLRLEQLSSPVSTLQKVSPRYSLTTVLHEEKESSLSSISTTSTDDAKTPLTKIIPPPPKKENKPHVRLQRTKNVSKAIDSQQLINAHYLQCNEHTTNECHHQTSDESDPNYSSPKILISSENGKFTSKVIIRSAPPAPPPRANNTKLSRTHRHLRCGQRAYLRTGSNPLTSVKQIINTSPSPSLSSGSSADYQAYTRNFERHTSFGSLSASSDESGLWEDSNDPYISHASIKVTAPDHSYKPATLTKEKSDSSIPGAPPQPKKPIAGSIPPPPPPPPIPTETVAQASPLELGVALSKEIESRQGQQGNGLRKVGLGTASQKKLPVDDPNKHQHEKLMEEFKKAHALMFSKKKQEEKEEDEPSSS